MPKTVAILEGDSSGLVSSIQDAKVAMQKLEGEGRKLTDQLRDVADQADVAAGNLVQKIGGGTAIKAIAGVTAGFAAAQKGVEMFLNSSEKLFASYGQNGQALWDDLNKQLNDIQGNFAKAVLQTDDLYEAYGRIYAALVLVQDMSSQLVESAIIGINLLKKIPGTWADILEKMGFFEAFDAMAKEGEARAKELTANMDKAAKSFEKPKAAAKTLNESIDEMAKSYAGLTGSSVSYEEQQRKQALAAIDNTVKQVEALALLQNMADNMSGDNIGGLTDAQLESLERLGKLRQDIIDGEKKTEDKPTADGGAKKGDDGRAALLARLDEEERLIKESRQKRLEDEEQLLLLYGGRAEGLTREQALREARIRETAAIRKRDADIVRQQESLAAERERLAATAKAEEEFDAKKAERDALAAQRKQEELDAITQGFQEYGQLAGQQLAEGEKASKVAEKLARKALGGQISALGDKAMAEAAILGAALNPLAIPMAAAGVAAYTAAAALGSDAKKATASTPAAAPAATQMNTNVSYNLQVDAAFANGESIARQFSMAQREAQRRGMLVPAGAF
jgi:hypothetical protein